MHPFFFLGLWLPGSSIFAAFPKSHLGQSLLLASEKDGSWGWTCSIQSLPQPTIIWPKHIFPSYLSFLICPIPAPSKYNYLSGNYDFHLIHLFFYTCVYITLFSFSGSPSLPPIYHFFKFYLSLISQAILWSHPRFSKHIWVFSLDYQNILLSWHESYFTVYLELVISVFNFSL